MKNIEQPRQIESERITNLTEFENIVSEARNDVLNLRAALRREDKEASIHIVEQIDLKLHKMEAYEFVIERRIITENSRYEHR